MPGLPFTQDAAELLTAEQEWITARRKQLKEEEPQRKLTPELNGLALSGGGIRSATFCLGVLQALERFGLRKEFDYLSTVSGGGYIGSCLTWFTSYLGGGFPFGTQRKDHDGLGGKMLSWLRAHGNYLVPGDSSRLWSLIAALAMGTFINLLILVPAIAALFYLLLLPLGGDNCTSLFSWMLPLAGLQLLLFAALIIVIALLSKFEIGGRLANAMKWRRFSGPILMWAVIIAVVGSIPPAWNWLDEHSATIWSSPAVSVSGLLSMWGAWKKRKPGAETSGLTSLVLSLGLSLLIYGIFLAIYGGTQYLIEHRQGLPWFGAIVVLSVGLAIFANINMVSMHSFYRDSLTRAYLPYQVARAVANTPEGKAEWANLNRSAADRCYFHHLAQWHEKRPTSAPYHLINTAQITVGSRDAKLRGRGADNFIFSPYYCGSASVGWETPQRFDRGRANLATALAISGAAVNPNSYATRSRPVAFLMTLFNVRLGYWIRRPMLNGWRRKLVTPHWYDFITSEMLGRGLNEQRRRLHLADGGHFENLGAYELLRRRCTNLVIVDAGQDKAYHFSELAKLIEMARVDFGINIRINTAELLPQTDGRSRSCYAKGTIEYGSGQATGTLLYIKPALTRELDAEDVLGYDRDHPQFPHESTGDQFFDEAQFEAYRELGYQLLKHTCKNAGLQSDQVNSLADFVKALPNSVKSSS